MIESEQHIQVKEYKHVKKRTTRHKESKTHGTCEDGVVGGGGRAYGFFFSKKKFLLPPLPSSVLCVFIGEGGRETEGDGESEGASF